MKKLLITGLIASIASASFALTLTTGFEAPTYNAANPTTTLTANSWSTNLSTTAGFSVFSGSPSIGSQSVLYTTNANTSTNMRLDRPGSEFGATNKYLSASAKIFIPSTGTNANTASVRQYGLLMNGFNNAVFLDQNGNIWTQNSSFSTTNRGTTTTSAKDRWVDLSIVVDVTGGTSTATVDGQTFTINTGIAASSSVTGFSLFSRSNGSSGTAGSNLGRAHFDSLNVTNTPVPEPATMAALGLGLVGIMKRRRKNS